MQYIMLKLIFTYYSVAIYQPCFSFSTVHSVVVVEGRVLILQILQLEGAALMTSLMYLALCKMGGNVSPSQDLSIRVSI